MIETKKNYQKIFELSKHSRTLQGIVHLLDWDQETYMPPGAQEIRAEQLKVMAGLIHREKTSKKFARSLSALIDLKSGEILAKELSFQQQAALKEWRRDYLHDTALPAKFVEEFAKTTSEAINIWRKAKEKNDFSLFAPFLKKIVSLSKKKADFIGYADHPYDALLDQFEPDMKTKEVDALFSHLRKELTPLIKKLTLHEIDNRFLFGKWDREKQIAFSWKILEAMGYDLKSGRLDFSTHPFSSSSHPTDSRITTRIHPDSLMSNIFVILHEGGHALYEMGLPQELYGSPLCESRSMGVHESQSRWWETRIGLSKPFWQYYFPILKDTFKGQLEPISFNSFYQAINKVKPSYIRVEADEVTYPLHVILRFELEKSLIEGSLKVEEIPDAWNAKMEESLGIIPQTPSQGCLQDIHWSMGAFGYFPTYTLGNLYAAHLFEAFAAQHPDWEQKVAAGQLDFIKLWLHENIYLHGRRYSTPQLLENATKKQFSAEPYLNYLKNKYQRLIDSR